MTTAIALETSKGDLPLAMGLGIVLITIVLAVNALAWIARRAGERFAGSTCARPRPICPPLEDVTLVAARRSTILDRISLDVQPGAPTVLLGPNGAGKTTLLRVAMGLIEPTAGQITWGGRDQRAADTARHGVPAPGHAAAQRARPTSTMRCELRAFASAIGRARIAELLDTRRTRGLGAAARRGGSRAASSSGWRWPARWRAIPRSCFSTSRPRASIRPRPRPSRTSSAPSPLGHQGGDGDARSRRGAPACRRNRAPASRPRVRERGRPPSFSNARNRRRRAGSSPAICWSERHQSEIRSTSCRNAVLIALQSPRASLASRPLGAGQVDRRCLHHLDAGFRPVRPYPAAVQGQDRHRGEGGRAGHRAGARHRRGAATPTWCSCTPSRRRRNSSPKASA